MALSNIAEATTNAEIKLIVKFVQPLLSQISCRRQDINKSGAKDSLEQ
jgi:hypothetical protein